MPIKINGRDLSKRMFNGLEVSKVMKNGVQIRPDIGPVPFLPEGFHIGTQSEYQWILERLVGRGLLSYPGSSGATSIGAFNYLKIPPIGYINSATNLPNEVGTSATICTSESLIAYEAGNYYIRAKSVKLYTADSYQLNIWDSTANGYSLRPIADSPLVPDSSWTALFSNSNDEGVFWNSQLGVITIKRKSSNRWIYSTIADKNLGATAVYDYTTMGTINIDPDCIGNIYQRGNCYGFDYDGGYSTSNQLVDASGYGQNEYSSSTFILNNDYPSHRQVSDTYNNGLW